MIKLGYLSEIRHITILKMFYAYEFLSYIFDEFLLKFSPYSSMQLKYGHLEFGQPLRNNFFNFIFLNFFIKKLEASSNTKHNQFLYHMSEN